MHLGIEIGGTKLQFGVGPGDEARLVDLVRLDVDPDRGCEGILTQIERTVPALVRRHAIQAIGVGFGGPVNAASGVICKSHQIAGWDNFPLRPWLEQMFALPVLLGNDCDCAALGEAILGAGRGYRSLFYVTVGTGVGGGYVVDGQLQGTSRPAVAEIGHLRPGLHDDRAELTVESLASGWGIAAAARARIEGDVSRPLDVLRHVRWTATPAQMQSQLELAAETQEEFRRDLLSRCGDDVESVTARLVAQAALDGNQLALDVLDHAARVLGWAIAQTITLLAPEIVVIGGGVSLMDEHLFLQPVERYVQQYLFPPLLNSYVIRKAALGEEMVVYGALLLCREKDATS